MGPLSYKRYHIETKPAPDIYPHPSRFRVRVKKHRLIGLLLKELVQYRGNMPVVLSRPCVYGVFSGPLGGLAPREDLCVGCLRCTTQYPDIVQIHPNPDRAGVPGLSLSADQVDTILYEARTGRVPVRGAGYRGMFGGQGWDGMWTDMSEIVRPTRDGIHGREFISTVTEIGEKPQYLMLDERGRLKGPGPRVFEIQVPFLFDVPPRVGRSDAQCRLMAEVAQRIDSLAVVPFPQAAALPDSPHVVPLVRPGEDSDLERMRWIPRMLLLEGWDRERYERFRGRFPGSVIAVRVPAETDVPELVRAGARVLHLTADESGRAGGRFIGDVILEIQKRLVEDGVREEVTLIGSGGIVLAEHVPKAIICGLDAVALDSAPMIALQGRVDVDHDWAVQRLVNLSASWRDQLLEILGAMGLREVRRLRGEVGRCMFQKDLEREAFAGIQGYEG
jgi:Conserved region in glutamate synthase